MPMQTSVGNAASHRLLELTQGGSSLKLAALPQLSPQRFFQLLLQTLHSQLWLTLIPSLAEGFGQQIWGLVTMVTLVSYPA